MEIDTFIYLELPGQIVDLLPAVGQAGFDLHILVEIYQRLVYLAENLYRRSIIGGMRA